MKISRSLPSYLDSPRRNAELHEQEGIIAKCKKEQQSLAGNSSLKDTVKSDAEEFNLNAGRNSSIRSSTQPGDVSKLFPRESRYSGGTKEPIRRRYQIFLDACQLCGIDIEDKSVMFRLFQTTFLRGPALVYFMDTDKLAALSPNNSIQLLECFFSGRPCQKSER